MSRATRTRTHDLLVAARTVIAEESHWTQGCSARDRHGDNTLFDSSDACCFCSQGALLAAAKKLGIDEMSPTFLLAKQKLDSAAMAFSPGVPGIITFNDHNPHATVTKAWDLAIEELAQHAHTA